MRGCVVAVAAITLVGCGPKFVVYVDSLHSPTAAAATRYCIPEDADVSEDLEQQEYLSYVHAAMQLKGFERQPCSSAEIVVSISYTLGEAHTTRWTTARASAVVPVQGVYIARARVQEHSSKRYPRTLVVEAWSTKSWIADKRRVKVWSTTATSWGYMNDLRRVLPVLLGASLARLGSNSGHRVKIELREGHKNVVAVKNKANPSGVP